MLFAKRLAATSLFLAAATLHAQESATLPYGRSLPVPGRSVITTKLGIVATSQPLASSAGVQILERGGNAIDAAIAANATLGLTEPMMNGIGGDLFAIIYEAKTGKLYGLNASGWAATGMTADFVGTKAINGKMPQRGVMTVNVPGAVAGWGAMQKKFGKLGFDQTLAPAIYYAEYGFPVGEVTAGLWAGVMTANYTNDHFKSTFLPGGRSPKAGEVFKNPDLAASLKRIAAKGTDGFYRGATADVILKTIKDAGGTMTAADLTDFTPEWVTPLRVPYRGYELAELPPSALLSKAPGIWRPLSSTMLKAGPTPRTVTPEPSPLAERSTATPEMRCIDSARLVSGNLPMSSATMPSTKPRASRLSVSVVSSACRIPVMTTTSELAGGACWACAGIKTKVASAPQAAAMGFKWRRCVGRAR